MQKISFQNVFHFSCFLFISTLIFSQEKEGNEDDAQPFAVIENVPVYPGCDQETNEELKKCMSQKIQEFVVENFNTKLAGNLGLVGKQKIYAMFEVSKSGEVTNINLRAPHPALDIETRRVIELIPKMQPGKHNGEVVGVMYSLPIVFEIEESKKEKQERLKLEKQERKKNN